MKTLETVPATAGLNRRDCFAAAVALAIAPGMVGAQSHPIRFGLTPVFLDDRVRLLRQWARYLENELGTSVVFVQFGSYAQVMDALRADQLDLAWICGYPYVLYQQELRLVSVPLWRKAPVYQSYLIVDKSSTVRTVDDLRARTFAYSDPLSNSGFLFVQHLLRSRDHDPSTYFKRPFFTYSHRHVVDAVSQGLAEAGAVDGYIWETLAEIAPAVTSQTRVMLRSPDFGFPPIVAPAGATRTAVARYAQALKRMPDSIVGQLVLKELRLDGFGDPVPGLFDTIAEMARHQRN